MPVTCWHIAVGYEDYYRHRGHVDEPQCHELHHESLQGNSDFSVGVDRPSQEDEGQDHSETDEYPSAHAVKQVVAVVLMAQLGDNRNDDINKGEASN